MLSVDSNNRVMNPQKGRMIESLATAPSNLSVELIEPDVTNVW